MSEISSSTTLKTTKFSNLLLSDLLLFSFFILSHPLYFSYFIFFSPYILKLLSFLSPLFITTSLLLIGFLVHETSSLELSGYEVGFLLSTYKAVTERLRSKIDDEDDEFLHFEDLETYKIVFDAPTEFYAREDSGESSELMSEENSFQALEISGISKSEALVVDFEERTVEIAREETSDQPSMEGKRGEGVLKEFDEFVNTTTFDEEVKKLEIPGINPEKEEVKKQVTLVRSGSEALGDKIKSVTVKVATVNGGDYASKAEDNSQRLDANVNSTDHGGEEYTSKFLESPSSRTSDSHLESYGSMRKEKEWKRTLACKLFEERHNVGSGGEGMDLLWETCEMDASSDKGKLKGNTKKTTKNNKKSDLECYGDDDECEEEDIDGGQLCCLQVLKFSTEKMNLGMGRPNLVKISKAIKGLGWIHHVTRQGRKGYN